MIALVDFGPAPRFERMGISRVAMAVCAGGAVFVVVDRSCGWRIAKKQSYLYQQLCFSRSAASCPRNFLAEAHSAGQSSHQLWSTTLVACACLVDPEGLQKITRERHCSLGAPGLELLDLFLDFTSR
jgi:hypothetical protein